MMRASPWRGRAVYFDFGKRSTVLINVVAVQARMGHRLSFDQKLHIFKQRPDFVCLPEFWVLDEAAPDFQRAALQYTEYYENLARLSDELSTCVVAGTLVEPKDERLYNTCLLFDRGQEVSRYRKMHPVPGELQKGISEGQGTIVLDFDGVRVGLLICGDVFYPELFDQLREQECDLVFIPTTSRLREREPISAKRNRDRKYFLDGAIRASAYICKVCGVGTIFGHPLQGRSLFAAPWGILKQVDYASEDKEQIMSVTLDIDELREFRRRARATRSHDRSALVD